MKKLSLLVAAFLLAVLSMNAAKDVVLDIPNFMDINTGSLEWHDDWSAVANSGAYKKDATDGFIAGNWKGIVETATPVTNFIEGDSVFLTFSFAFKHLEPASLVNFMRIGLVGADAMKVAMPGGEWFDYFRFDAEDYIGFRLSQDAPADASDVTDFGTLGVTKSVTGWAAYTHADLDDWGFNTVDSISDTIVSEYIVVKTAVDSVFSVSLKITNAKTGMEIINSASADVKCGSAYNDDSLFFTTLSDAIGTTKLALVSVKLEKTKSVTTTVSPVKVSNLTLSPNPTTGYLQLSQEVKFAQVYSTTGALVKTISNTTSFDVSDLGNGIYFLRTEAEVVKFIKQ